MRLTIGGHNEFATKLVSEITSRRAFLIDSVLAMISDDALGQHRAATLLRENVLIFRRPFPREVSLEFQRASRPTVTAADMDERRNRLPRIPIFPMRERRFPPAKQSAFATVVTERDRLPDYPPARPGERVSLSPARGRKRVSFGEKELSRGETAETKRDPPPPSKRRRRRR